MTLLIVAAATPGAAALPTPTTVPPQTTTTTTIPAVGGLDCAAVTPLASGSRGAAVMELQVMLARLGYAVGRADGVFGGKTRNAVIALQRSAALPASGVVDKPTCGALTSAFESYVTDGGTRPPRVVRPGTGMIALTFDDGPDPRWTPQVLDILAQYGVHATFFVMGSKAARYPELIARMLAEGHSVQNHTHSHQWLTRLSVSRATTEIASGRDEITAAGGVAPRCLRPPFGAINTRVRGIAVAEHQEVVMWDVDPQDWRNGADSVVRNVLRYAGAGDKVVLLHDGEGPVAGRSLPRIIEGLEAKGLGFATICS